MERNSRARIHHHVTAGRGGYVCSRFQRASELDRDAGARKREDSCRPKHGYRRRARSRHRGCEVRSQVRRSPSVGANRLGELMSEEKKKKPRKVFPYEMVLPLRKPITLGKGADATE